MIDPEFLKPFTRFCVTIGNLPTAYFESMSYYEQLTWFCNYLEKTVIPAINNNAEALEEVQKLYTELKAYVDNYFENLDVQEEIDNKLDEMASDGTLAPLLNEALKNVESVLDTQFINAEDYYELDMTGFGTVQSFCYDSDNNKTYVGFLLGNNTFTIKRFSGFDFSTAEATLTLPINCHGNSMVYYEGKLFIANYITPTNVDIVDCSSFTYSQSISMGSLQIRSFEIFKVQNHVYIAVQEYNSLKLHYYMLMPNNKFIYMATQPTNLYYGPKNATRIITNNSNKFMVFCNASANRNINQQKGNILEWYIPFNEEQPPIKLGLLNVDQPIEDILTISTDTYLLLGEYGQIYLIQPKITEMYYPWLYNSVRSYTDTPIWMGNDVLNGTNGYEYETYNIGSENTCKLIKSFLLPMFPYTASVTFIKQDGAIYTRHTENIVAGDSTNMRGISLPIFNIVTDSSDYTHIFKGSIIYYGAIDTIDGVSWYKYTLGDINIKELIFDDSGKLDSQNSYTSFASFKTYIDTNNLGLAIGNINIDNIRSNGNFTHITWETSEVTWL